MGGEFAYPPLTGSQNGLTTTAICAFGRRLQAMGPESALGPGLPELRAVLLGHCLRFGRRVGGWCHVGAACWFIPVERRSCTGLHFLKVELNPVAHVLQKENWV